MAKITSLTTPLSSADAGIESINFTVQQDGASENYSIPSDSPNFPAANAALEEFKAGERTNEELATALLAAANLIQQVTEKFEKIEGILAGRMAISGNTITVDYEPIDPALETYILRLLNENNVPKDRKNWNSFARFVEKLYSNTSENVRNQLFGWLQYENTHGHGFTIAEDGDIIGYKGCAGTIEAPVSINSGRAIVDGVPHNGHIPNNLGSIIEMPRSAVQDDPAIGCSTGLHIGTYGYASSFSRGVLLKVKWSPADTVSVPTECAAQKVRVCRYTVLEVIEGPDNSPVHYDDADWDDDDWDDRDYDECPSCGADWTDEEFDEYCDECEDEIDRDYSPSINSVKSTPGSTPSFVPTTDSVKKNLIKRATTEGLEVSFVYNNKARRGVPLARNYGPSYLDMVDGGFRKTFLVNKIFDLKLHEAAPAAAAPASQPAAPVSTSVSEDDKLELIRAAQTLGKRVDFTYSGTRRAVHPHRLYKSDNAWLMVGKDGSGMFKSFRVAEMDDIATA